MMNGLYRGFSITSERLLSKKQSIYRRKTLSVLKGELKCVHVTERE
ncbi:hypothetical protein ACVW18_004552 [Bacillus thuringiensis]